MDDYDNDVIEGTIQEQMKDLIQQIIGDNLEDLEYANIKPEEDNLHKRLNILLDLLWYLE